MLNKYPQYIIDCLIRETSFMDESNVKEEAYLYFLF
jgi:hypothetical protein